MSTPLSIPNDSVVLVHKPLYYTTFDAIRYLRRAEGIKKIGHAGTLDPLATGLIIVCTGVATKQAAQLIGMDKTYTGTITLGATTPSYDLETTPENHAPFSHLNESDIAHTAASFVGESMQEPPMFSALKKDGARLYTLARRGEFIARPARKIIIYHFDITRIAFPQIDFCVHCSSGTYIRSMAHDFGQRLGCGAYLSALCRTRTGDFYLRDALDILPARDRLPFAKNTKK